MRISWFGVVLGLSGLCASGCGDDEADDGSGASGTGASGTGASGTGASGTGGSGASAAGGGGGGVDDPPPAGKCREEEDCDFDTCLGPGDAFCGGACYEPQVLCADDSECKGLGAEGICVASPCNCDPSAKECVLGCGTSSPCADGTICGATFRCEPTQCEGNGDCPDDFTCAQGMCGRTQCDSDAVCDGHCVKGSCWTDYGVCGAAPGG